jgi:hypothetical protein
MERMKIVSNIEVNTLMISAYKSSLPNKKIIKAAGLNVSVAAVIAMAQFRNYSTDTKLHDLRRTKMPLDAYSS